MSGFFNWIFLFFVNHFDMRRRFKDKGPWLMPTFSCPHDLALELNLNHFPGHFFSQRETKFPHLFPSPLPELTERHKPSKNDFFHLPKHAGVGIYFLLLIYMEKGTAVQIFSSWIHDRSALLDDKGIDPQFLKLVNLLSNFLQIFLCHIACFCPHFFSI